LKKKAGYESTGEILPTNYFNNVTKANLLFLNITKKQQLNFHLAEKNYF